MCKLCILAGAYVAVLSGCHENSTPAMGKTGYSNKLIYISYNIRRAEDPVSTICLVFYILCWLGYGRAGYARVLQVDTLTYVQKCKVTLLDVRSTCQSNILFAW